MFDGLCPSEFEMSKSRSLFFTSTNIVASITTTLHECLVFDVLRVRRTGVATVNIFLIYEIVYNLKGGCW